MTLCIHNLQCSYKLVSSTSCIIDCSSSHNQPALRACIQSLAYQWLTGGSVEAVSVSSAPCFQAHASLFSVIWFSSELLQSGVRTYARTNADRVLMYAFKVLHDPKSCKRTLGAGPCFNRNYCAIVHRYRCSHRTTGCTSLTRTS